ncbi:MAG: hypothetical protein R3C16_11905 [Hyphomonadaceae bacterium]
MSEGEAIEQLVQFTNILLVGVSLIFSIISAYVVALNYFIGSSNFTAKLGSFLFVSLVLAMMVVVMAGGQTTQMGLIDRLRELETAGELTAAGRAVLLNAEPEWVGALTGHAYSLDDIVRTMVWANLGLVYVSARLSDLPAQMDA